MTIITIAKKMINHGHEIRVDDDHDHEGQVNPVKEGVDSAMVDIDMMIMKMMLMMTKSTWSKRGWTPPE